MRQRNAALTLSIGLFAAAIFVMLGGAVMGIAMGGHMGMMSRGNDTPQTPAVSDASKVTVDIRSFEFFPRDLTVNARTEVTWTNQDSAPHDASDDGKSWMTGILKDGDSEALTFDTAGTYPYHCSVHPYMKATLTVR